MKILAIITAVTLITIGVFSLNKTDNLPVVAIANYGPHSSLTASIEGFKAEMQEQGFRENTNLRYEIADVGFNPALISQMISKLKNYHPKAMVVMTTPVAQYAKSQIKNQPLVYNVITDPIEAGLIKNSNEADVNMTGSSDRQDLEAMLSFAKKLIPHAKRVGLLYATSESNDQALLKMMNAAAAKLDVSVIAIAIDQARDVPMRMQEFKDRVDFIYVGTSGPIQPTLPAIAQEAKKMSLPVLNADNQAVKDGLALASFGVDYVSVGRNAGKLVAALLKGADINTLKPIYPSKDDHLGFISKRKAQELGTKIPQGIDNLEIVE